MMRRLVLIVVLAAALSTPTAAQAYLPAGFIGLSPQSPTNVKDYELMRRAGVDSVRLPLSWAGIQAAPPSLAKPDWAGLDKDVELAAENGIRIMLVVGNSPGWVAPETGILPVRSAWQRLAWANFLRSAVERYGPEGEFWEDHTKLPFLPIHRWEVWNEENIVTFTHQPDPATYAVLLRISGRVLHGADPESKVLLGGLFGRPLQVPPNVASGDFLSRVYRAGNIKPYFDGVALHPYVADAKAMGGQIENLRRIMRIHHDTETPIYVTELGWGSHSGPTRWERGPYGQANQLSKSFGMLSANRLRWRIGGVWWFSWTDEGGTCSFCSSAGLLTEDRKAKPSWYRFNEWTGGDPDSVPKAAFDE